MERKNGEMSAVMHLSVYVCEGFMDQKVAIN